MSSSHPVSSSGASAVPSLRTVNVGIYGAGVVGGGVVELLREKRDVLAARGFEFVIKHICVRDTAKVRDFTIPASAHVSSRVEDILEDESVELVVEVMGGLDVARRVILECARRGKAVVTANKALLAAHLDELGGSFRGEGSRGFAFEAAVAGGIPIIRVLTQCMLLDSIRSIGGIINGTSNFILSKMAREGLSYAGALAEAQALGFAEADPTADVDGLDARHKLVILTKLSFGITVPPQDSAVYTRGIRVVGAEDVAYAAAAGYAIKLIASARLRPSAVGDSGGSGVEGSGSSISSSSSSSSSSSNSNSSGSSSSSLSLQLSVTPSLVHKDSIYAKTDGALNVVAIDSASVGKHHYHGAGAGRFPTGNSVVADMLCVSLEKFGAGVAGAGPNPFPRPPPSSSSAPLIPTRNLVSRWYIRTSSSLEALRAAVAAALEAAGHTPSTAAALESIALVGPASSHHAIITPDAIPSHFIDTAIATLTEAVAFPLASDL